MPLPEKRRSSHVTPGSMEQRIEAALKRIAGEGCEDGDYGDGACSCWPCYAVHVLEGGDPDSIGKGVPATDAAVLRRERDELREIAADAVASIANAANDHEGCDYCRADATQLGDRLAALVPVRPEEEADG